MGRRRRLLTCSIRALYRTLLPRSVRAPYRTLILATACLWPVTGRDSGVARSGLAQVSVGLPSKRSGEDRPWLAAGARLRLRAATAWCRDDVFPQSTGHATRHQTVPPRSTTAPAEELPGELLALLGTIEDFTYDFDHPGYYALFEFVQRNPLAPGFAVEPVVVEDWRVLLERPGDFRGRPITVTGIIGRNKDPYTHPRYPQLGQAWQVELRRLDQATTCTVIFTNDVSDLPVGATIRVTGYFVKINRYPTQSARPGLAALLIAPGPIEVSSAIPPRATQNGLDWRWMIAAIIVALAATLYLFRRSRQVARHDVHTLRASHGAPLSLADDLAEWAERERPDLPGRDDDNRQGPGSA